MEPEMEPLNDKELRQLLRQWKAPDAPPSLRRPVLPGRMPWWRWLLAGTVRIPVPMAVGVMVLLGIWGYLRNPAPLPPPESKPAMNTTTIPGAANPSIASPVRNGAVRRPEPKPVTRPAVIAQPVQSVSFADFQPVRQLELEIIRGQQ
jgi:hypothetical protein